MELGITLGKIAACLVDAIWLAAGLIKANDPQPLAWHVFQLGIVPRKLINSVVGAFIILECLLGACLLVGLYSPWVMPLALAMLTTLTLLSVWGTASGRVADCGCYNGLLDLSPRQSALINIVLMACLAGGLGFVGKGRGRLAPSQETQARVTAQQELRPPDSRPFHDFRQSKAGDTSMADVGVWKFVTVGTVGIVAAGLPLYYLARRRPFIELSPLKVGRPWNPEWLRGQWHPGPDPHIVFFLHPHCPLCETWGKVLGVVHQRQDLPSVLGVVEESAAASYAESALLKFPLVTIKKSVWARLVFSTPGAVVLEDGEIQEKWRGAMPQEFVARIKTPNAKAAKT